MARRKKVLNFGTVSIGATDSPTPVESESKNTRSADEAERDLKKKVDKYKSANPEKPKDSSTLIQTPLSIKRNKNSFEQEYIDLAKKYLGMPDNIKPTVGSLAKGVVKLFEDNVRLFKKLNDILKEKNRSISSKIAHSWEHDSSWN